MDESQLPPSEKAAKHNSMQPQADVSIVPGHVGQPDYSRTYSFESSDIGKVKMAQISKGKEKAWAAIVQKEGPLHLLDLPMDVLKDIVKEVTHTNDLASLALTHSALHSLTIPHIYSRFDIVWPDAHTSSEPRNGVDALTYGLATLVMRKDLFSYVVPQRGQPDKHNCIQYNCNHCGMANHLSKDSLHPSTKFPRPRRGNLFSQYTRKFSLGNGPADWVQEYLITKEGGKMLGTLVALTVARMPNLETFIWDMPTGVLRDIWYALGTSPNGHISKLEKVWIRFHDNREVLNSEGAAPASNTTPPLPTANTAPAMLPPNNSTGNGTPDPVSAIELSYQNTECPSFSILPPLKSLTVLEIDEPAYLVEMSALMQRSLNSLRELRVGISVSSCTKFTNMQHLDSQHSQMQYLSEGVLGLIMSKIYDCRPPTPLKQEPRRDASDLNSSLATAIPATVAQVLLQHPMRSLAALTIEEHHDLTISASIKLPDSPEEEEYIDAVTNSHTVTDPASSALSIPVVPRVPPAPSLVPNVPGSGPSADPQKRSAPEACSTSDQGSYKRPYTSASASGTTQQQLLRLESLELENIYLSVPVLQHSIDWSILTSLTLLQGTGHEQLWKFLRRTFSPISNPSAAIVSSQSSSNRSIKSPLRRTTSSNFQTIMTPEYRLRLRKLHTDSVSAALISFLKETLAPNSLEWLILQDRGKTASTVPTESIYRGPLRHHRSSLAKVSIDSSSAPKSGIRSARWKRWQLSREILTFITSGKMSSLRELGMSVDFKDWHYFLQRLPNIPHLRSLYVPHISEHSYPHHLDAKDLASQVVDLVIALRPEIELCYMGILTKCFEVLENRDHNDSRFQSHNARTNPAHSGPDDSDDDTDGTDDDHDEDPTASAGATNDSDETDSDGGMDSPSDSDDEAHKQGRKAGLPRYRLREILFYDDKITIFKARHGRL